MIQVMKWHVEKHVDNLSYMRYLVDSRVWKELDNNHCWFSQDLRNVSLGLMSDSDKFNS